MFHFFIKQSSMLNCFKLKIKHMQMIILQTKQQPFFKNLKAIFFLLFFLQSPARWVSVHFIRCPNCLFSSSFCPSIISSRLNKQTNCLSSGCISKVSFACDSAEAGRFCTDAYSWQHVHEGWCGRQSGSFLQTVQRSMGLECKYSVFLFITALEHREQ